MAEVGIIDDVKTANKTVDPNVLEEFNKQVEANALAEAEGKNKKIEEVVEGDVDSNAGIIVPEGMQPVSTEEDKTAIKDLKPTTDDSVATAVYNWHVESGLLPEGRDIKSVSDVTALFEEQVNAKVTEVIESFPEKLRNDIEVYSATGQYGMDQTKPKAYIETITEKDLSNEEVAENVIKEVLKANNKDASYIDRRVKLFKDGDVLTEEATELYKEWKEMVSSRKDQEIQRLKEDKEKADKEIEIYYESLYKIAEDTKTTWGIEMPSKDRDRLKALMSIPVKSDKDKLLEIQKAMNEDPSIWVQVNYLYMKGVLGKAGKLDSLVNRIKSEATEQLKGAFGGANFKLPSSSNTRKTIPALAGLAAGLKSN